MNDARKQEKQEKAAVNNNVYSPVVIVSWQFVHPSGSLFHAWR